MTPSASEEVFCNNQDDDCDGQTDEGSGVGDSCSDAAPPECQDPNEDPFVTTGKMLCGEDGPTCTATPIIDFCLKCDSDADSCGLCAGQECTDHSDCSANAKCLYDDFWEVYSCFTIDPETHEPVCPNPTPKCYTQEQRGECL